MTTRLQSTLQLLGREAVDVTRSPAQGAGAAPRSYDSYSLVADFTDLELPPVDLSTEPGTIDLTAAPLARDNELTLDLSDESANLYAVIVYADPDNAGPMTFGPGASNGYPVPSVTLRPGDRFAWVGMNYQSVNDSFKNIDVGGTAGDELHILAYFDVFGTGTGT
jgi:hypothetical protein